MEKLHYNYVYFNHNYSPRSRRADLNEFNAICVRELSGVKGVKVCPKLMDECSDRVKKLELLHERYARKYHFPFKKLWYPLFCKFDFEDNKPMCFVFASRDIPCEYVMYLKRKFPDCKTVRLYRDLLKVDYQLSEYTEEKALKAFDYRITYDQQEAASFGMGCFTGPASRIQLPVSKQWPLYDVYFCGQNKKRLDKIVEAYDKFSSAGLKCRFIVLNFSKEEKIIERPGIEYRYSLSSYMDILEETVNSLCILDINQEGASGYTPRFMEAVMYDRLLITDNVHIAESDYYNPSFISIVKDFKDMDVSFVDRSKKVSFNYRGDFSPVRLIENIDRMICEGKE